MAPDPDMVCAHRQIGAAELFILSLPGQPDTNHRCPVGVEFRGTAGFFYGIRNTDISGRLNGACPDEDIDSYEEDPDHPFRNSGPVYRFTRR